MIYIVDASVAVKWFVKENLHDQALRLLDTAGLLQAPDLIVPEVANIAWKKSIRGELTKDQARVVAMAIRQFIPRLHSIAELTEQALDVALTLNHPVYDCLYLACADVADGVLITADKRLHDAVQDTDFSRLVRYLGDPDFMEGEDEALPPLEIPLSKVERVVRASELLEQVYSNVYGKLTEGKELPSVNVRDMEPYFSSPAYRRLKSRIEDLSESERADILALGWLGRGFDGTEFQPIRDYAENWIKGHARDSRHVTYVCGITYYLRNGLAILRARP